jgi:hypothetical protein
MSKKLSNKKCDQSVYVVYKVTDWRKYWYNDPNPVVVKTGLNAWEARRISLELSRKDFDGPLHLDGRPIGLHKYCRQENWDRDCQHNLFAGNGL